MRITLHNLDTHYFLRPPLPSMIFRDETDKELNVQARMPAWAKGKSVVLEMTKTHIKLALKEEEDKPIIEVRR